MEGHAERGCACRPGAAVELSPSGVVVEVESCHAVSECACESQGCFADICPSRESIVNLSVSTDTGLRAVQEAIKRLEEKLPGEMSADTALVSGSDSLAPIT